MWDILEICYVSFCDELLIQYIRDCNAQNIDPTLANFWKFSSQVRNPNYVFIQEMVLSYLHVMMLLRKGIRGNMKILFMLLGHYQSGDAII